MVAVGEVKTNGVGKVKVDLVDEAVSFPELTQHLLLLILQCS